MSWFPLLLVVHVVLAVSLLLPSILLPFVLRGGSDTPGRSRGVAVRALSALHGTGSLIIGAGLAITGGGLLVVLGPQLLSRPWLLAALTIYAANLLVAAFIARPNLRRLVGREATSDAEAWNRRARRQRWLAYAIAGATGLIGFLMSAKPEL